MIREGRNETEEQIHKQTNKRREGHGESRKGREEGRKERKARQKVKGGGREENTRLAAEGIRKGHGPRNEKTTKHNTAFNVMLLCCSDRGKWEPHPLQLLCRLCKLLLLFSTYTISWWLLLLLLPAPAHHIAGEPASRVVKHKTT